jgi:hypothetical protein
MPSAGKRIDPAWQLWVLALIGLGCVATIAVAVIETFWG